MLKLTQEEWYSRSTLRIQRWGYFAFIFFASLAFGATNLLFEGAVVSNGSIQVFGENIKVQHKDGGIVENVYVSDGQFVSKNDILMKLDGIELSREYSKTEALYIDTVARILLLNIESHNKDLLSKVKYLGLQTLIEQKVSSLTPLFRARYKAQEAHISLLEQRVKRQRKTIIGHKKQKNARVEQIAILNELIESWTPLLNDGYIAEHKILELEQKKVALSGEKGSIEASIEESRLLINELSFEISKLNKDFKKSLLEELGKLKNQQIELDEHMQLLLTKISRLNIRAPASGKVLESQINSVGQILKQGDVVLSIVPSDRELIVVTNVESKDINNLNIGLDAKIRFVAFNEVTTPEIYGSIIKISPDSMIPSNNQTDGKRFYKVNIAIDNESLKALSLLPGMPVEVHIATKGRSLASYLLKPVNDAISRTFRE